MMGGPNEPELADDLVGVASARLIAIGVPRGERLRALRLLSVLATLADADRRVRRPLAMVASEFDLPAGEVEGWLDDLVAVGAVHLEGTTMVLAGREPDRGVAISLHDFLDAAAELDTAPARPHPPWVRLVLRPSSAVVAAAAVVALAVVGPKILVDDDGRRVSNSRPPSAPAVPTTAGATSTAPDPGRAVSTTAPPAQPVDGGTRVGPVVVSTTSTTLLPCPVEVPGLEVLGATTSSDGHLAVDGVARNTAAHPLQIDTFTLRTTVHGEEVVLPGLPRPLVVPPGGEVLWQSLLPVLAPPGTTVRVTLGDWTWLDLDPGLDCPSP